jgi:hypothetical protein
MPTGKLKRKQRLLHDECVDADDLWDWLFAYLGLRVPRESICAGHTAPFEYVRRAYFDEGKDLVVWAARGAGKTRLGAAVTLLELLHKKGISIRILGGSLEQSMKMGAPRGSGGVAPCKIKRGSRIGGLN